MLFSWLPASSIALCLGKVVGQSLDRQHAWVRRVALADFRDGRVRHARSLGDFDVLELAGTEPLDDVGEEFFFHGLAIISQI